MSWYFFITLIFLIIVNAVLLWVSGISNIELRKSLEILSVRSLDLSLIVFLIGGVLSAGKIRQIFLNLNRKELRFALLVLLAGGISVSCVVPATNRIYFDEHIYQNIAQGIALHGKAVMAMEGDNDYGTYQIFSGEYNKQPNGFPYYLSTFFSVFGVSEGSAHLANNVAYLIGCLAVLGIGSLLFESSLAALFSMAIFALTPMVLIWSNTSSSESVAVASASLAVFISLIYARFPSVPALVLMIGGISLAAQVRPEFILIVPTCVLAVLSVGGRHIRKSQIYLGSLALTLLLTVPLIHLFAVRNEKWGSQGERFAWEIFEKNILVNGPFYLLNDRFPLVFTVLGVLGLILGQKYLKKIPLLFWFAWSWGIFLFFYAGSYNYGADVRFSLISSAPLALLAGWGSYQVTLLLEQRLPLRNAIWIVAVLVGALWVRFLPFISSVGRESSDSRLDVESTRTFAEAIPPNSIVISHHPYHWLVLQKNALHINRAANNLEHINKDLFSRYRGGVYYHRNFWCNVPDPPQNALCDKLESNYKLEKVKELEARGHRYGVYRVFSK